MDTVAPVTEVLLEARGISKRFPGVLALDDVHFELRAGEVHALVGENGAGKSTLMHILAGVLSPDSGVLCMAGRALQLPTARAAQRAGIGMVFQEGSLAATLSVAENVFCARQPANRLGVIDRRALRTRTRAILDDLCVDLDPDQRVEELSLAERQMVEIAKVLSLDARVLILDEPTSALTSEETEHLFVVIDRVRRRGAGIVYVSHRLAEVFRIADRITVLKDGRRQATRPTPDLTSEELISLMVGRACVTATQTEAVAQRDGPPPLEVHGLCDGELLRDVSLVVYRGEIVALAGLSGAGRTELALTVFGARRRTGGEIKVDGRRVECRSPRQAIETGIGYLPEDRKETGLFLDMSITDNVVSGRLQEFGGLWFSTRRTREVARDYCRKLRVASPDIAKAVGELSGGNQQKVALAKWLLVQPRVLIVDEPTRGIDVGAKSEVHAILRDLAKVGTAVLLISSELPEVLAVADRVYVMREGRIVGEMSHAEAGEEAIMRLASLPAGKGGAQSHD